MECPPSDDRPVGATASRTSARSRPSCSSVARSRGRPPRAAVAAVVVGDDLQVGPGGEQVAHLAVPEPGGLDVAVGEHERRGRLLGPVLVHRQRDAVLGRHRALARLQRGRRRAAARSGAGSGDAAARRGGGRRRRPRPRSGRRRRGRREGACAREGLVSEGAGIRRGRRCGRGAVAPVEAPLTAGVEGRRPSRAHPQVLAAAEPLQEAVVGPLGLLVALRRVAVVVAAVAVLAHRQLAPRAPRAGRRPASRSRNDHSMSALR